MSMMSLCISQAYIKEEQATSTADGTFILKIMHQNKTIYVQGCQDVNYDPEKILQSLDKLIILLAKLKHDFFT